MTCFLNLLSDDLLNVLHASSLWGPVRPRVLRVLTATRESDQSRLQWLLVQAARVVLSGGNGGVTLLSFGFWWIVIYEASLSRRSSGCGGRVSLLSRR